MLLTTRRNIFRGILVSKKEDTLQYFAVTFPEAPSSREDIEEAFSGQSSNKKDALQGAFMVSSVLHFSSDSDFFSIFLSLF